MESKNNYSYFIIKPDGIKFFPEIKSTIEEKLGKAASIKFFKIEDFAKTIKQLYYKHFEKEGFGTSFEQYLNASDSLFGNLAILILVSIPKTEMSKEFFDTVLSIKHEIRRKLVDPNVCAISNNPNSNHRNFVKITDINGEKTEQRFFTGEGNYRISGFNIIHCPDSTKEDTVNELRILCKNGIICDKNMLDIAGIEELLRFASIRGFNGEYTECRPNIAGFLEKEIEK